MALAVSLDFLGDKYKNTKAEILASTLDEATEQFLEEDRSPSRKVGELDTRGSHFYLTLYWAKALAKQSDHQGLQEKFSPIADLLESKKEIILSELLNAQGKPQDIGGYYLPDSDMIGQAMRPSSSFNSILDQL